MIFDSPGHLEIFPDHSWIDSGTFIFFMENDEIAETPMRNRNLPRRGTGPVAKSSLFINPIFQGEDFQNDALIHPQNIDQSA